MTRKGNAILKVAKVLGWTILSVVVVAAILLFGAVKFLESKELSPFVERIANDYIDGNLKIGSLKLGFRPRFPILGVDIEDLSIQSHAFKSLSESERGLLPIYADSLLTLGHMSGSLDIKRLLVNNELALHDVVLRGLSVNLVIAHDGKANYDIVQIPSDSVKSQKINIPGFRIDRFALEQPKEIRFYNASDSTSASVLLLTDAAVNGDKQPSYRLSINGNVTSPKATLITNLDKIDFGLNGTVYWNPSNPGLVAMDGMEIRGAFINAVVNGEIDLKESPIVKKGIVDLAPVAITDLLTILPDSIRQLHRLYEPYFSTDATIAGRFELASPMNLATDTLPTAKIDISIPSSSLKYGNTQFDQIAFDLTVNTLTNLPDSTVVNISRLILDGPATQLKASAVLSSLFSDPAFDGDVQGKLDLTDLPPIVREKIPGYLSGVISADIHANGRASVFKQVQIQKLVADGSVSADNIYFLSADTSKMVEVGKAKIDLDSKRIVDDFPVLSAKLNVDTVTILVSGIDLALGSIKLDAGVVAPDAKQDSRQIDNARMLPISGNLNVGMFNITTITNGAGAKIRNIAGRIRLYEPKGKSHVPELSADIRTGNVSAGTLSDRFLINDAKVKAFLSKLPSNPTKKDAVRKKARSFKEYSYISPAEVHKYVYNKRIHKKRIRRVYGDVSSEDEEILVWNLTKQFRKFLNEWKLRGSVNTDYARLLTPLFPIHNNVSKVAIRFNNDTVDISRITVKAGKSDITMSGLVTNVRRALTSTSNNNLKGSFSLLSDTIDINELSATVFTGASYVSDRKHGKTLVMDTDNDDELQARLDDLSQKGPGRSSPVLIPVNIDANLRIEANHTLYSDIDMLNMGGDILVYDGGVNLHDLKATSDAGTLSISALYSGPKVTDMHFGFGMELSDFNIAKFVKLVPAIDSITPLMHDFSGMIGADIAATCRIDSGMNLDLPSLNAAIRITGDNLAFIDPEKYRTLGKWLGFKNKADNTIHSLNVEMTVIDGLMRVYPFAFNIDRYRLGIYGSNDIAMNFDYHLSVLKSPIPFKFGITVSGNPKKYKVRFGGAKFKESTVIESVDVVNAARINLLDQIENVFKRGVRNSRFAKLQIAKPTGFDALPDPGLSASDSLQLIQEGLIEPPVEKAKQEPEKKKKKKHKRFLFF